MKSGLSRTALRLGCAVIALALCAESASAQKFVRLVDTTGDFSSFGLPSINDAGVVVFGGTDGSGEGIFTIDRYQASPTTVADTSVFDDFFNDEIDADYLPAIAADGSVAFGGDYTSGGTRSGVFLSDGSAATGSTVLGDYTEIDSETRDDTFGSEFSIFGQPVAVNSFGEVNYTTHNGSANTSNGVYVGNGGGITTIALDSDFDSTPSLGISDMNDFGDVAYTVLGGADAGLRVDIFGGFAGAIADPGDFAAGAMFGSYVSYNDNGLIAFTIDGTGTDDGIWTILDDGSGLTRITSELPKLEHGFALNNFGDLAWIDEATGELRQYVDSGDYIKTIAGVGGMFDGELLGSSGIALFRDGYSETGITVVVELDGGVNAVYLIIPEPGAFLVLGVIIVAHTMRRRRLAS